MQQNWHILLFTCRCLQALSWCSLWILLTWSVLKIWLIIHLMITGNRATYQLDILTFKPIHLSAPLFWLHVHNLLKWICFAKWGCREKIHDFCTHFQFGGFKIGSKAISRDIVAQTPFCLHFPIKSGFSLLLMLLMGPNNTELQLLPQRLFL